MKKSKTLKLVLIILICLLISLIGFVGIYMKNGNMYKNMLPEYKFASDLTGTTVIEFEVDNSNKTIYYDKDGKEVDSSVVTEENKSEYTTKEIPVNVEENLKAANYKKVVEIMKKRLEFLQANQYKMDLNEKTGKIVLSFEDDYPDDIKSILPMEGKLELIDLNTQDVILSYNDFNSAEATYAALDNGSYVTYINLKLNNSGIEKINNIDNYKNATSDENKENEEEKDENKFKIMFDKDEIAEVSYDDILLNSKMLRITTATNLTSDSSINSELNTNTIISKIATMGKLPVVYNVTAEEYIQSDMKDMVYDIALILTLLCIVISIYFIIRYKLKGIIAVFAFAANISIFLILIRLTNIQISLNGFAGILGLITLNTLLVNNILKNIKVNENIFSENIKNAYIKTIDAFVIMLIIFVVFAFSSMTVINTMGLLVFWGWLVIILGNLGLTVPILSIIDKK